MFRFIGLLLFLLYAVSSVPGFSKESPGYEVAAAALDHAIVTKDIDALKSLIADDFAWVRGSGRKGDKDAFIKALTSDDLVIEPFQPAGTRWMVSGASALLTGSNRLMGKAGKEAFVDEHWFADYWQKRQGRWRLVYIQITPFPPKTAAK